MIFFRFIDLQICILYDAQDHWHVDMYPVDYQRHEHWRLWWKWEADKFLHSFPRPICRFIVFVLHRFCILWWMMYEYWKDAWQCPEFCSRAAARMPPVQRYWETSLQKKQINWVQEQEGKQSIIHRCSAERTWQMRMVAPVFHSVLNKLTAHNA